MTRSAFRRPLAGPLLAAVFAVSSAVAHAQESRPATPPAATLTVPATPNPTCPIMGKPSSLKLFVDTAHGRVYTCCAPCNPKIKRTPDDLYRAAYPKVEKVGNTVCPVTGRPVPADAPTIVLQGREIALCCKDCVAAARDDAQRTLARALDPQLVDIGNDVDPTNGKPVGNFVAVVSGKLIRFASTDAIEEARKDPAAALAKAEASAAAAAATRPSADAAPASRRAG